MTFNKIEEIRAETGPSGKGIDCILRPSLHNQTPTHGGSAQSPGPTDQKGLPDTLAVVQAQQSNCSGNQQDHQTSNGKRLVFQSTGQNPKPSQHPIPDQWRKRTGQNGHNNWKPTCSNCTTQTNRRARPFTKNFGTSQRTQHKQNQKPSPAHPNELRDLIRDLASYKAAGPDGAPSQLLKSLTFRQITAIAHLFTQLANSIDYRTPNRPDQWDHALAIMIPKHPQAQTLDKHRTISLMNQTHKLYTKWLLAIATPILDSHILENQIGFRRTRQPSEALFTLHRLTEIAQEWEQPLTILRLDLSKAFDRMKQSAILQALRDSDLPKKLTYNLTRELIGTHITPHLYGITAPEPIALARGAKQGAPGIGGFSLSAR